MDIDFILQKDFFVLLTDVINFIIPLIYIYFLSILTIKTKKPYYVMQIVLSIFYLTIMFRYSALEKMTLNIDIFYWFLFEAMVFISLIYNAIKDIKNEQNG